MKKNIYVIMLLGFLSLTLTACTKKVDDGGLTENGGDTGTEANGEEETFNTSLADLMKLGKNVKCNYEYTYDGMDSEGQKMEGIVYVSGDKTRSEVKVRGEDGKEIVMNSITNGNTIYSWSSEENKGIKMTFSEEDMADTEIPETGDTVKYQDVKQEMEYRCVPWIPNNSKFEAPGNVEFIDYNQMIEDTMKMMEDMNIPSME
jgi:hypothetical protein